MRLLAIGWILLAASMAWAQPVTFESLLREMTDREALARWPEREYRTGQFSSYDRRSVSPEDAEGWFANRDFGQFLREEVVGDRREFVMAEMEGPGAVVRIWSANPKGTLRIYLDRAPEPVIEYAMADLLGGKWTFESFTLGEPLAGIRGRGYNLYLPIPFAQHCKITCDEGGFYYVVNYRTYEPTTDTKTLAREDLAGHAQELDVASRRLAEPEFGTPLMMGRSWDAFKASSEIAPGQRMLLKLKDGPSVVRMLGIKVDPTRDEALRSLVLAGRFDGEETIWCPVGDYFGWGTHAYFWLMPYRESAEFELINLGAEPVHAEIEAAVFEYHWDDRSMHFYARWRHEYPIRVLGGRGTADWNYVEVQGQGVYVGDTLSVINPVPEWWGEGDEKIYVDGERFPSHFGTGTEDYYGYAWCSSELFQHPFHSQTRCDGAEHGNNWGHSTVSRLRMLDAIPFERSLKMDMELWHWRECEVSYSATTFFYARPGARHNRPAIPEEAAKPVPQPPPLPPPFRIEGAMECEALKVVGKSDGLPVVVQDMRGFGAGKWSGEKHLWVQGRRVGDFVELEIPAEGRRAVTVHATRSWDYGIVCFSVNGRESPAGDVDLFSGQRGVCTPSGALNLGVFEAWDGKLVLRAEVVGRNPEAAGAGAFFGLDAVVLSEPTEGGVAPGIR